MIAVAVGSGWRNQSRQSLNEFQRREDQGGTSVRPWLRQPIKQPLFVKRLKPLQSKRRAGTIAQQPLQPGLIMPLDTHRGIHGETTTVASLRHFLGVVFVQVTACGEPA